MSKFKLSRYWNKMAYKIMDFGAFLVWDYTGKNKGILGNETYSEYTREIMSDTSYL